MNESKQKVSWIMARIFFHKQLRCQSEVDLQTFGYKMCSLHHFIFSGSCVKKKKNNDYLVNCWEMMTSEYRFLISSSLKLGGYFGIGQPKNIIPPATAITEMDSGK